MHVKESEKYIIRFREIYSVCGLVCPRMEEQISGAILSWKFKRPSISGWEGPSCCPKYSKVSYDHFGGWLEKSNPPHVFSPRRPGAYWGDLSCAVGAAVFVGSAHSIFPNFVKIAFLLNSIAICLLSTSAALQCCCSKRGTWPPRSGAEAVKGRSISLDGCMIKGFNS